MTEDERDDRRLVQAIMTASDEGPGFARKLIIEYYLDADRAERTPYPVLMLHLGMLCGAADREAFAAFTAGYREAGGLEDPRQAFSLWRYGVPGN